MNPKLAEESMEDERNDWKFHVRNWGFYKDDLKEPEESSEPPNAICPFCGGLARRWFLSDPIDPGMAKEEVKWRLVLNCLEPGSRHQGFIYLTTACTQKELEDRGVWTEDSNAKTKESAKLLAKK